MIKQKRTGSPRTGVTAGQHSFAQVPGPEIQRSTFNRSNGLKTNFDAGDLVPIFCDEALPGDTMDLKMSNFARMATPIYPVMDNIFLDFFFFAVPYRLVWENWEKMNGDQQDPGDSTDFLVPIVGAGGQGFEEGSLSDYLGIPTKVASLLTSSLFHRAYNLIWNEFFRDQNLQDRVVVDLDDGPDSIADYTDLLKRGKRHDYFTSCLPFPQKGEAIPLPLGTSAPLVGDITGDGDPEFTADGSDPAPLTHANQDVRFTEGDSGTDPLTWDDPKLSLANVTADLTNATAATINELRQSFQIQRMFEKDARGGTRYTEVLRSHFGVVSEDQRLQRPEYLGGGTTPINVHAVANQNGTLGTFVGDLGAFATAQASGIGFKRSFTEHCLILGMCSARADLNYQQGLDRMFSRRTRFDFYWPSLAHLGEQAVLNKEIYADNSGNDDLTFGYQERFAEYRYKPSKVTAQMRSNASTPLDAWHLSQDFEDLPVLDATFIEENPPMARVIAVPSEPQFLMDCWFDYKCTRPMPLFSVPGLIDHF